MHFLVRICFIGIFALSGTVNAFAASEDEIQKALDQKKFSDNLKLDASPGDFSYKSTGFPDVLTGNDISSNLDKREPSDIGSNEALANLKKPKITLKVAPGDGQLKLSWSLANLQQKAEDGALRFIVSWGIDPSQLKQIEVGSADSYVIRELKNHQPYLVQVTAYKSRKKADRVQSEEKVAIPVPSDEQDSPLENLFSRKKLTLLDKTEPEPFKRELRQFGYDFFKNSLSFIDSQEAMPVSGGYTLGSGDTINLTIWGPVSFRQELAVDRNGEITIPKIGVVTLAGLTYDQAKEAVNKAIARYYKNYNFNLTLGKTRTIQIFAVGEVENPGSILVSSQATLINALSAAGGPSRNGSLRRVRLMREGTLVREIDLYQMFLAGDRSQDLRLQNGDTIFVPVIGPVAAVAGEVRRPAIYELKEKASLADVIQMAGGITASGYTGRIQVERVANNTAKIVLDYQPKGEGNDAVLHDAQILDRDMVKIFPVQEAVRDVIVLRGNVARPGEYQFKKGMHIRDVIKSYSDLLPESHLEAAEITRLALPDYHKEIVTFNLRKALNGEEQDNIPLREQDSIKVFSRLEMQEKPIVAINGHVMSPGAYDFYPGMTVRDLIAAAGSTRRNAILDLAELTRISITGDKATSTRLEINLTRALSGDPQQNLQLQPDDVLIIRGVSDWIEATDKFVTIKGEVRFPGVYSVSRGEKISSVIERAGGFTEKAYLKGAKFTRRTVKEIQQKRMDEVILRTEKDILQKQFALSYVAASKEELEGTRAALEGLLKSLERLRTLKAEGRVVIRLARPEQLKKTTYDMEMEGGDVIDIPSRPSVVNVMGQVYNPTTFVYLPENSDVETYLSKAGGPTRDAEASDMYIIKADGSVFSRQQSSFGIKWSDDAGRWTFGSFLSSFMDPGDTLVVPQKLERTAWLRDIKDITTILSQVALTAGSVFLWFK